MIPFFLTSLNVQCYQHQTNWFFVCKLCAVVLEEALFILSILDLKGLKCSVPFILYFLLCSECSPKSFSVFIPVKSKGLFKHLLIFVYSLRVQQVLKFLNWRVRSLKSPKGWYVRFEEMPSAHLVNTPLFWGWDLPGINVFFFKNWIKDLNLMVWCCFVSGL